MHLARPFRVLALLIASVTCTALAPSAPLGRAPRPAARIIAPMPPILPTPFPPHDESPEPAAGVRSSTVAEATLDGGILTTSCNQTFSNSSAQTQQVEVLLPVPAAAVVSDAVLLADGREYRAEVLPAAEARGIYEAIVRQRRDPALLELAGHGLIRLSAFPIPAGGTRTVSYRFHQPLPAREGRQRVRVELASLCGADRRGAIDFTLQIDGVAPLAQVSSSSHEIEVRRLGASAARVRFRDAHPDPRGVLELSVVRDARDVGLDLRTARGHGADDYFLLSLSPGWQLLQSRARTPQTAVFVLDTSGSMEGEKFAQAQAALSRFLDDLRASDRFNLVAFASNVRSFARGGPVAATSPTRRQAREWVEGLAAGGGTNIAEALETALTPEWDASLVLFLTDGKATEGETDPTVILRRAAHAPRGMRFYAFGVGYDVDAHLLDDLARRGHGSVTYVHPGEDVGVAVGALRRRVERPCVRDVQVTIDGARVRQVFPSGALDLFADQPLLIAGRVAPRSGRATVRLEGRAPDGRMLAASWPVDFEDADARSASVPVLWASRKAAALLDDLRHEGRTPARLDSLRALASRYGILTEELALLAREPDQAVAQFGPATPQPNLQAKSQRTTRAEVPQASRVRAPPPSPDTPAAVDQVQLSESGWNLRATANASKVADRSRERVTVEGHTFRRDGETWTDIALDAAPRASLHVVRVRSFGTDYFALLRQDARAAKWFALGERVRIRLDTWVLDIAPDAPDAVGDDAMSRLSAALAR